ncbi:MAG: hypothetical protein M1814_002675 [Vezdaea aestivalis]|nr:MAG: hypothetical protein M1814_002675 [Vezdaea aestivalis]
MPFVPPGARKESIATYVRPGSPVQWEEYFTLAADGCRIVLCVGHPRTGRDPSQSAHLLGSLTPRCDRPRVVIFYFQGNASSLPPRLPALSKVLQRVADTSTLEYVLVAVSYRGYWKSSGRPSQSGIELDADAALGWAEQRFGSSSDDVQFMIWGQSIGAGVAARAVERWLQRAAHRQDRSGSRITQLVLETPFTSMRDMLVAVYPQKWLPYRYLWPFLRNWWDTKRALKELSVTARQAGHSPPAISIVQAGKDELVPEHHAVGLENVSRQAGLEVKRLVVNGALHTETMFRSEGIDILTSCLQSSERVSQTKGEQ